MIDHLITTTKTKKRFNIMCCCSLNFSEERVILCLCTRIHTRVNRLKPVQILQEIERRVSTLGTKMLKVLRKGRKLCQTHMVTRAKVIVRSRAPPHVRNWQLCEWTKPQLNNLTCSVRFGSSLDTCKQFDLGWGLRVAVWAFIDFITSWFRGTLLTYIN